MIILNLWLKFENSPQRYRMILVSLLLLILLTAIDYYRLPTDTVNCHPLVPRRKLFSSPLHSVTNAKCLETIAANAIQIVLELVLLPTTTIVASRNIRQRYSDG
uniref:Uncharacterized protein n=1 Tax=Glossina austeni TaxID=7395 RepID=A0A1A9UQ39_GLOAU